MRWSLRATNARWLNNTQTNGQGFNKVTHNQQRLAVLSSPFYQVNTPWSSLRTEYCYRTISESEPLSNFEFFCFFSRFDYQFIEVTSLKKLIIVMFLPLELKCIHLATLLDRNAWLSEYFNKPLYHNSRSDCNNCSVKTSNLHIGHHCYWIY